MRVASTDARKRWADVLDAVNRAENVVVTRRGKPYAVVMRWREPSSAPEPLLLATRLPEPWRLVSDGRRDTMTVLHPSGLWAELAMDVLVGASESESAAVVDALERARRCGVVGQVLLSAELRDGLPFVNVTLAPALSGWSTCAPALHGRPS